MHCAHDLATGLASDEYGQNPSMSEFNKTRIFVIDFHKSVQYEIS
jgi:hypothetical protein